MTVRFRNLSVIMDAFTKAIANPNLDYMRRIERKNVFGKYKRSDTKDRLYSYRR